VRDLQKLTDVEQFGFAEGMHRAPPPERASMFGCAVVFARPAQGATLTLRKQRSPGLCRAACSSLVTSPFSGRHLCDPSLVELPGIEPAAKSSLTSRNADVDDAKQREQT
jgi:hypothetical protein